MFKSPNSFRITTGPYASTEANGCNGAFRVRFQTKQFGNAVFTVIQSDSFGWEHVSVSLPTRCPSWEEMCIIKGLFWDKEDTVVQFHPPESQYVNNHPFCLHLWRNTRQNVQLPPKIFVGI